MSAPKLIIGLVGPKQCGKSTTTNIIKEFYPPSSEVALASKLKDTCAEIFGLSRECFDDQRYKEIPFRVFGFTKFLTQKEFSQVLASFRLPDCKIPDELNNKELGSPRIIAQIVGTEVLRRFGGRDIHCNNVGLSTDIVVISDVRFLNEYEYFSKYQDRFLPLYIKRDVAEAQIAEDSHISEREFMIFRDKCVLLDNNGTISDLRCNLEIILSDIPLRI